MGLSDYWYKNAVIYSLDVETFQDSDGDGIGDFPGLTRRLDYLSGLGVTCLWLQPFHPTPNLDNGYDVTDYYGVDPRHGTLGDFVEFAREARDRGIRIIMDLVVNHTSVEHPWFQAARRDPNSKYRNYYVWADQPPQRGGDMNAFPGEENSIWRFDEVAHAYYLHCFYCHQPDLNLANKEVRKEIRKIMGFWVELGVSGFRLDAAPFLIAMKTVGDNPYEKPSYEYLREFRDFLDLRHGDAVLLAEANVDPQTLQEYFAGGDRLQMAFNFYLNQHLFLALAQRRAAPLAEALCALPRLPGCGQFANFLRNHDELDLGRLSDEQRQQCFRAFAPEPHMQLYGRGIRRRLPPMLGNDPRRLRLAYSLLLTLPGTPVLRYGEEIGMGDDLSLPGRDAVRTPMQWTSAENGGFSTAPPEVVRKNLAWPPITDGPYGCQRVNVADQQRDPNSLLDWMEHAIRTRRQCPQFGWGDCQVIRTDNEQVFAHASAWRGRVAVAVHNLSPQPAAVALDVGRFEKRHMVDLLGDREYHPVTDPRARVELEPYGHRWFLLDDEGDLNL